MYHKLRPKHNLNPITTSLDNEIRSHSIDSPSVWHARTIIENRNSKYLHDNTDNSQQLMHNLVNAPWYVKNEDICKGPKISTVKEEIGIYAKKYKERMATHPKSS